MLDGLDWNLSRTGANYLDKYAIYGENPTDAQRGSVTAYRHGKAANVLYYDGHVEKRSHMDIYPTNEDAWDATK